MMDPLKRAIDILFDAGDYSLVEAIAHVMEDRERLRTAARELDTLYRTEGTAAPTGFANAIVKLRAALGDG